MGDGDSRGPMFNGGPITGVTATIGQPRKNESPCPDSRLLSTFGAIPWKTGPSPVTRLLSAFGVGLGLKPDYDSVLLRYSRGLMPKSCWNAIASCLAEEKPACWATL
jgi:hypothetical protein